MHLWPWPATLLLLAFAVASAYAEGVVWVEAEQFDHYGGWLNDAQFIDQMGSPYLLAIGIGTPVEDARTTVSVPVAGTYRLWVRTKDWMPEHHPGQFQVVLGDRVVEPAFGRSGDPVWRWEDGDVHELAGEVEIRLHDLSGYYGRCDAIMLTTDVDYRPPVETGAIAELRETHGGVSRRVQDMPEHDVVVVGGGLAGCTAAVAAARGGARTALIQNRPILGGNASSEILVPPVGAWPSVFRAKYPLDPRETGLIEEYRTAGNQRVSEGKLYSKRLLRWVKLEPNLDLHLSTHATGVEVVPGSDTRIAAVLAVDVRTGRRMRFVGGVFIDCTGDAVIGVAAGAEYRHGKEPRSMYDEPWAPRAASRDTMGNGLKYAARDMRSPQPFAAPPWAFRFPTCESFGPGRHPRLPTTPEIDYQWNIELGGRRDTYADAEEIRDDLLRVIHGLWDHTKNHCARDKEKAAHCRLVWVGHVAGKRENRRLIGDYVLTQNDIARQTLFPDRVAFGAWSVDDHYSAGFFHDGPTGRHMDAERDHHYQGVPFSIPFRCLYSRNIENLMMAGRDISASHLALSNTRVMLTCAILGHATGTAAALCTAKGTTPRGLYQDHIEELQQELLKQGAAVFEMPNTDPRDLARRAAVRASSERAHESGDLMAAGNVINGHARAVGMRGRETTNAWGADPDAPSPHWIELEWEEPTRLNVVHVSFQTVDLAPRRFALEAWRDGAWRRVLELTDNRHRRHVLGLDSIRTRRLRVVLQEPAAICEIRVYDEPQRVVEIARRAHANMRLPDEGPWLPWAREAPAEKLDGIVMDDPQAERTGEWVHSTWAESFIGYGYLHDDDSGKGARSLTFRPEVTEPGTYEVRIAYSAYGNRATNTPVTIHAATGATTVHIDQRQPPPIDGTFLSLGTFALDDRSRIVITNADTDGHVVVDALQLLAVAPSPPRETADRTPMS